jgi:hypothetical protein
VPKICGPRTRSEAEVAKQSFAMGGPEGVAVATSRAAEGEGHEDWVLPVPAVEGFMNNAG